MSVEVPSCDLTDPAQLEAWFGNFGYAEHYRKVVLASCREIVRARATLEKQKLSESKIDDMARTHENYLQYLVDSLNGRRVREGMARERWGA
jgi:hypothetical protein